LVVAVAASASKSEALEARLERPLVIMDGN